MNNPTLTEKFKNQKNQIPQSQKPLKDETSHPGLTDKQAKDRQRLHKDFIYDFFKKFLKTAIGLLFFLFFSYLTAEFYFIVFERKDLQAIQKISSNIISFFLGIFIKVGIDKYFRSFFPSSESKKY